MACGQPRTPAAVLVLLTALGLASLPSVAAGQQGEVVVLPPPGRRVTSKLQVTFDTRWVCGNGYRPVRVQVSPLPPGPSPTDRDLTVQLQLDCMNAASPADGLTIRQSLRLAAGTRTAETTILVPQRDSLNAIDAAIFEGRKQHQDVSGRLPPLGANVGFWWSEERPRVLGISRDVPSLADRERLLVQVAQSGQPVPPEVSRLSLPNVPFLEGAFEGQGMASQNAYATLLACSASPYCALRNPAEIPVDWLGLTVFDIITLSVADCEALAKQHPDAFAALSQWLAAGGNLCLFDAGVGDEGTARIDRLFPRAAAADESRGWTRGDPARAWSTVAAMKNRSLNSRPPGNAPPAKFRWRNHLTGTLVAFDGDELFRDSRQATWMYCQLFPDCSWAPRHGISLSRSNPGFWQWMIPGVGAPPVNLFLILITLLVIVLGPVNYLLLMRARRLALMLVTVPLGASLITLLFVGTSLMQDGLATRVRVLSLTELDASGKCVTWSNQMYYASMVSPGGLSFPRDAAVYPYFPEQAYEDYRRRGNGGRREVSWTDQQRLSGAYLRPRTPAQFLVIQPGKSSAEVDIRWGATPTATNRLGTTIERLYVIDAQGAAYFSEGAIEDGQAGPLTRMAGNQIGPQLVTRISNLTAHDHPLQRTTDTNRRRSWRISFAARNHPDASHRNVTLADGKLLTHLLESVDQRGIYLAVVKEDPHIALGINVSRVEQSLHVIKGSWQP